MNQKGAALIVFFILVAAGAAVLITIFATGITKNPLTKLLKTQEPSVVLAAEYKNPFDEETQYVNPFSEYKNPFDLLK